VTGNNVVLLGPASTPLAFSVFCRLNLSLSLLESALIADTFLAVFWPKSFTRKPFIFCTYANPNA